MNQGSPVLAAAWAKVEDPVCAFQDVEVVLDDHDRVPLLEQRVERLEELGDVVHVQPGCGLVKYKEGVALPVPPSEEGGEFDALRFAAAERIGALAEGDVSQADILEGLEFGEEASDGR